jgi:hypothetical protein
MMLIACLARRLNSDVDYATFRRAWIPDEIIDNDPRRRVLSGLNLEDPRDLFTIAIIKTPTPRRSRCDGTHCPGRGAPPRAHQAPGR